jgi:hypothetical protein
MRLFLISFLVLNTSISAKTTSKIVLVSENFNLTASHFFQNDTTDLLVKAFKKGHSKNEIISIPKGKRPDPSNYLKWRYRHRHQRNFRRGASFLTKKQVLDKYGRAILGRQDGLFVMCKKEMDDLIHKANGQLSYVETELGIPSGIWKNAEIIRIDIRKPKNLNSDCHLAMKLVLTNYGFQVESCQMAIWNQLLILFQKVNIRKQQSF